MFIPPRFIATVHKPATLRIVGLFCLCVLSSGCQPQLETPEEFTDDYVRALARGPAATAGFELQDPPAVLVQHSRTSVSLEVGAQIQSIQVLSVTAQGPGAHEELKRLARTVRYAGKEFGSCVFVQVAFEATLAGGETSSGTLSLYPKGADWWVVKR